MIVPEERTRIPVWRALPVGQALCQMLSMLYLVALTTSQFTDGEPEASSGEVTDLGSHGSVAGLGSEPHMA